MPKQTEKTQTAVDWMFEKLWEEPKDKLIWQSIIDAARIMERNQLMEAYRRGMNFPHILGGDYNEQSESEKFYQSNYEG